MFTYHDIYISYDLKDSENSNISLLFNTLNSIGFSCWKDDNIAIEQCQIFICFISSNYIENSKCNLEDAHKAGKIILPVLIEKIKLSKTSIGDIINENEVKYYSTFKKDFDWLTTLTATILEKFKRPTVEDKKFDYINSTTNHSFHMLNRMCMIENFIIAADWELNAGVHILSSNFEYLESFNNNDMLKRVTGLGQIKKNQIAIATFIPNTKESFIFIFQYNVINERKIEFKEIHVIKNLCDEKERDLASMSFKEDLFYVVDRSNSSILVFNVENLQLYSEFVIFNGSKPMLPNFYKKPVLGNIFIDKNGVFYFVDSKSGDDGNCCIHKFIHENNMFIWTGSFGNAELNKPVSVLVTTNTDKESSVIVLERSSPAILHIYDDQCKYKNSIQINGIDHCSSILITNGKILVTNLSKKICVFDQKMIEKLDYAGTKVSFS
jgi:hypothetical protein